MRRVVRPKRITKEAYSIPTIEGEIPFVLTRSSARKTLTITIDEKADVGVASPYYMKEREVFEFINEKARWITEKVRVARRNKALLDQKEFDHGKKFLFLGKKFKLSVFERNIKRGNISFNPLEGWFVTVPQKLSHAERRIKVKEKMLQWYRIQAKEEKSDQTHTR